MRLLANGRTRALAKIGDRQGAERAIGQDLELSDLHDVPAGITSCISFGPYGYARTLANAITANVSLRNVDQILKDAQQIDDLVEHSDSSWSRSLIRLDVSTALLQQRSPDLERAMALGREGLVLSGNSPIKSVWQRSHDLREQARRWRNQPVVREYDDELRAPGAHSQQPWPCRTPGRSDAEGEHLVPVLSADPAAFPTEPPADLHDPAAIAAHDWAAFSALEEITDHWSRPGWSDAPGRTTGC
ncbi:hypothetical protein [Streptomyces sp. 7N604]|uniref:hypothetical protein n=1 Tax=Streptomyces sp. 7N604 TaxID=3457415 RepID=UPI003FD510F5